MAPTAAELQQALRAPFDGYCAEAPAPQRSARLPPAREEELQAAGLRLAAAQVIFRHGARDLSSDKQCFRPIRKAFKNCSVQTLVAFTGGFPASPSPLVRQVLDAYPSSEAHLGVPGCGLGALLDEAVPQTRALAGAIRARYGRLVNRSTTRLYSTGKQRTEATLFLMQRELLGDAPDARLFSRPLDNDPWALNEPCPRAGQLDARHARHYVSPSALIQRRFPDFARRWKAAAGTDFEAGFHDCLLVAKCSKQKQLGLPKDLQPDGPLYQEALRVSLQLFQEHYLRTPEAIRLLAAPMWLELESFLHQQAQNATPSLALWATHDTTILVMLTAMNLWDGQWPPYTDTLVLEVYREKASQGVPNAYVRLSHRETPLVLPWCQGSAPLPELCHVDSFLPPWLLPFRDEEHLRTACAVDVRSRMENSFDGLDVPWALLAVSVLGFLLGRTWTKLFNRKPRSSSAEALLA
ncbi:unnamed protein product [Effrenium voratum]|nr:unnamed protein product [Effrenium voratum]